MEEFTGEEEFDDENFGDNDDEYEDDAEELFRQNPLRAIFVRQGEILEALDES